MSPPWVRVAENEGHFDDDNLKGRLVEFKAIDGGKSQGTFVGMVAEDIDDVDVPDRVLRIRICGCSEKRFWEKFKGDTDGILFYLSTKRPADSKIKKSKELGTLHPLCCLRVMELSDVEDLAWVNRRGLTLTHVKKMMGAVSSKGEGDKKTEKGKKM